MNIYNRILCDLLIFIFAILFPWWASMALAIYAFTIFDRYFELAVLGLMLDILYGTADKSGAINFPIAFAASFLLYLILGYFKKYLRSDV